MNALDSAAPGLAALPMAVLPQTLDLPGCERRLAYAAHYWPATLLNVIRPHRLRSTVAQPRLCASMTIPASLRRGWDALFQPDAGCPLLVNQSVGTLLYTRLFSQLGLNFSRLLHVQHRTQHLLEPAALAAADAQTLLCELKGCWQLGEGKALVVLETHIARAPSEGGALLARVEDRFLIRRVPQPDWVQLPPPDNRAQLRDLLGLRKRRAALDAAAPDACVVTLPLAHDLGRRYGRVSGDHNPVHTTPFAARLFGQPRPFAQGLALRNLIVSELHRQWQPLQRLQLTFAQPAYLGQDARLVLRGNDFELLDEQGALLAFGSSGA